MHVRHTHTQTWVLRVLYSNQMMTLMCMNNLCVCVYVRQFSSDYNFQLHTHTHICELFPGPTKNDKKNYGKNILVLFTHTHTHTPTFFMIKRGLTQLTREYNILYVCVYVMMTMIMEDHIFMRETPQ